MAADDPILHSRITASLGEFGDFEKISGGVKNTQFTPFFEGGEQSAKHLRGTHEYSDIVLERAYRPARDKPVKQWDDQFARGYEVGRTVTKTVRNAQGIVIDTIIYPICEPTSVELPDGIAGDNSLAMVKVTLKVRSVL